MPLKIWKDFSSLLFPITCYACKEPLVQGEEYLCIHCRSSISIAQINPEKNSFLDTHSYVMGLTFAIAYFRFSKEGISQKMLHTLKYSSHQDIGNILGKWFGEYLSSHYDIKKFDGLIPVPLHKRKEKVRGFNQSQGHRKWNIRIYQNTCNDRYIRKKCLYRDPNKKK